MQDARPQPRWSLRPQRRSPLGAFILIALGVFFLLQNFYGNLGEWLVLAIGLAFLAAHVAGRTAAIPAGILTGLGAGIVLRDSAPPSFQNLFFMLPLGLGFVLIWLLDRRHRWAFWPAATLVLVGLLSMAAALPEVQTVWVFVAQFWPVALVALGAWILWRQYRRLP